MMKQRKQILNNLQIVHAGGVTLGRIVLEGDKINSVEAVCGGVAAETEADVVECSGLTAFPGAVDAHCVAFKAFLACANPAYPSVSDFELLTGMQKLAEIGGICGVHAENDSITAGCGHVWRCGNLWRKSA